MQRAYNRHISNFVTFASVANVYCHANTNHEYTPISSIILHLRFAEPHLSIRFRKLTSERNREFHSNYSVSTLFFYN